MTNWDEFFKDAPAKQIYEEFNQVIPVLGNDNYFQEAIEEAKDDSKIKEIYTKFVGNLLNNSKFKGSKLTIKEYCMHLHFWLYDQIITKFRENNDDNKIMDIMHALFGGWFDFIRDSPDVKCSPVYSTNATLEEWIRGKLVLDYFKNYDYITNNYSSSNKKCEEYRTYLKHINEQYEEYKKKCSIDLTAPCNNYYSHIDKYNPNVLLSEQSCEDKNVLKVSSTEDTGEISEAMGRFPSQGTLDMGKVQDHNAPSVSVYNIVVASSSILGTFTFFFIFYRLTPLGHWLRTRLLGKKLIDHNKYEEESNEYLENTYDQENILYNSSRHNVGYNPLNIP
ncbi:PIR protein [Plasmodium ovale]|uniref:PIR protein n=1 Tax=Plasmodium ovale TaxID=36330 RepID=A0A1C3KIX3_PLAOA|nr:PIR protein [Plasmodium ovale]